MPQPKKRVLVTGATGFLGRHLIEYLCSHSTDTDVVALVRDASSWTAMEWTHALGPRVEVLEAKLDDLNLAERVGGKLDGIYHLAAVVKHSRRESSDTYATNVNGTSAMVRLGARMGCRVLFVSTSGTVGCFSDPAQVADEHAAYAEATVGRWPYYHSKILAEKRAFELAKTLGTDLVVIRPPVMLGPGDHRFRTTKHLITALRGKFPFLIEGGMHFVDVRDVVAALSCAMALKSPRPIYHLPGTSWALREYFEVLHELSGLQVPAYSLPAPAAIGLFTAIHWASHRFFKTHPENIPDPVYGEMASMHWGLTSLHSRAELGFTPRDPRTTLKDTLDWLKENHPKLRSA